MRINGLALLGVIALMLILTLGIVGGVLWVQAPLYTTPPASDDSKKNQPGQTMGGGSGSIAVKSHGFPPMVTTAQCNGPKNPNCTRHDIWTKCFLTLVDRHPKDGFVTEHEVDVFMDDFLRFYEKLAAPSPREIAQACDHPFNGKRPNGRVNWPIFESAYNPVCLGRASDICYAKGACDRELAKLGLPLTTVIYE